MGRFERSCFLLFVGAAFSFAAVFGSTAERATAGETEVGLSLGPLVGVHDEPGAVSHVPPIPLPIVDASYRSGPAGIAVEGFPFALPIQETNAVQQLDTHLAFFDAMARGYVANLAWFGIGELAYNQRTLYAPEGYIDASRVAGVRFEMGADALGDRSLHASVAVAPNLNGTLTQIGPGGRQIGASERGSQTEFRIWRDRAFARGRFSYGVRYVNYVARFNDGALADRNTGVIPFVRYAVRFGRP